MVQQCRAERYPCSIPARLHLPTGGTVDATVVDISESGALFDVFEVTTGSLELAVGGARAPRRSSSRLPSHFIVQLWSDALQTWAEGRIASGVRVGSSSHATRIAVAFMEPLQDTALAALGVG